MRDGSEPDGVSQASLRGLTGYNLKRAYMRVHRDFRAALDPFGLTQRTFSVLSLVVENPGISQSAISRALEIERSGTVVIVDELERRGLIRRDKVSGDRRSYALRATGEGAAFQAEALAAVRTHEERVFGAYTAQERRQLIGLLERIQIDEE